MAITETYLNTDLATGLNDGTSEANAWQTWGVVTMAANQRLNVKNPATRADVNTAFAVTASGSNTGPVCIEGYDTTPGDGGRALFQRLALSASGSNVQFKNLDILNSNAAGTSPFTATGFNATWYNCKAVNTTGTVGRCFYATSGASVLKCEAEITPAAAAVTTGPGIDITNGIVYGCTVKVGAFIGKAPGWAAIRIASPIEHASGVARTVVYADRAVTNPGNIAAISMESSVASASTYGGFVLCNNTIDNFPVAFKDGDSAGSTGPDGTSVSMNNLITNCPTVAAISNDTILYPWALPHIRCATDGGWGFVITAECVRITEDPYTDAANGDFSLNEAAGGGGSCRARGMDANGTLDIGAIAS